MRWLGRLDGRGSDEGIRGCGTRTGRRSQQESEQEQARMAAFLRHKTVKNQERIACNPGIKKDLRREHFKKEKDLEKHRQHSASQSRAKNHCKFPGSLRQMACSPGIPFFERQYGQFSFDSSAWQEKHAEKQGDFRTI